MQDPTTEDTLRRLEEAEQLKLTGKHAAALEMLEELLVEDPANISALEEVADNELHLDHLHRAEIAAKQAVELDQKSYTGHYILGFTYSKQGKWEPALVHLQRANLLQPNDPEILRCLGWALLQNRQRTQGIVTLERALNLDVENPLTLCDLGIAYLQAKNVPKAKSLFLRTLDIDPANPRAIQCVQAIEKIEQTFRPRRLTKKEVSQA